MTSSVSLADIRQAAERKFGSYEVDLGGGKMLVLRNALRLGKKDREKLLTLISSVEAYKTDDEGEVDVNDIEPLIDVVRQMLRLVANRVDLVDELITTIGDDLPVLLELLEGYMKVAMPGEASPSDA